MVLSTNDHGKFLQEIVSMFYSIFYYSACFQYFFTENFTYHSQPREIDEHGIL